jgi:hypothetical protein
LSCARSSSLLAIPPEVDPDDELATSSGISFHQLRRLGTPAAVEDELLLEEEEERSTAVTRFFHPAHYDSLVAIDTKTHRQGD